MSCENSLSNHCSRTYWTPAMERYFIDLMLEHIHRGNRIGHTFKKQAWIDMLAVFNSKFGSQYDKDVLKGRYTNLWKFFNDIKNILGQNGFSWDQTRQMVVADDYVWDTYIKIHPEARAYKTKSVLNFGDLCLIYGYTVADGRYSRSSHDVDVDDDTQGVNFGDCNSSVAPSCSSRTEWTAEMDQYFMELMLQQKERGNKIENTFTKQAWTDILAFFNAKFCSHYNKRVLRHRYRKLCKYYSDLTTLVKQKGFRWDEKWEMVVADDDVWDAYLKAHPQARFYRAKVFSSYKNLVLVFGEMISKESQSDCGQDNRSEVVVAAKGGERSRTYWTPPMDRFLIDLMLEQVHRGNQIGQSFITQAWKEMVESFNANFETRHNRDVLKNRYKHFKKQYNDVRILLQHSGFSWDKSREMVTAVDHVWDAYIKAHPDARLYRVKIMPCFHKLCVICGQDKFDGSDRSLVESIDPAVGNSLLEIGNGKEEEAADASADFIVDWTPQMEKYLIDLMLEQMQNGNKIDNALTEQAWVQITLSFKENFGPQYEQNILDNRRLSLMKQYVEIINILSQQGFMWDESSQTITADNDGWESYAKEHPEAISYRDKVIGYYGELCNIFGTSELFDTKSICDIGMEIDQHPIDIKIGDYSRDFPGIFTGSGILCDQAKKRPPSTPLALDCRVKSRKTVEKKVHGDITYTTSLGNSYSALESAIDALQAIPDIDDELLLDGCDLLEDEKKAKTFLALDESLRKKWLLRKLGRCL